MFAGLHAIKWLKSTSARLVSLYCAPTLKFTALNLQQAHVRIPDLFFCSLYRFLKSLNEPVRLFLKNLEITSSS